MKDTVVDVIGGIVSSSPSRDLWRHPLVAFADAHDPLFGLLRVTAHPSHLAPSDILDGAQTVVVYFIPFSGEVVASNTGTRYASDLWIRAYRETNSLVDEINNAVDSLLATGGFRSRGIRATHDFEVDTLTSPWSHRHAAVVAGLGTLGANRMLITEVGCCGRIGSIVTEATISPGQRPSEEFCLFKRSGMCLACLRRCPVGALGPDRFDRRACYDNLLVNDRLHDDMHPADACGKCLCGLPCSLSAPRP